MADLRHAVGRQAPRVPRVVDLYRRLPEGVRRCLRPLNLLDECASFLPSPLAEGTATATEMTRRVLRIPRVRHLIRRLEGRARGGARLVSVLAVDEISARFWTRTLFADPPSEMRLGWTSAFGGARALAAVESGADLSLRQAVWPVSRLGAGAARVPSSVPLWLDTARPFEAILLGERRGRASRKDDARRVRRLDLRVRLTTSARDLEWFRRELYEPYASDRFGDLFLRVPPHAFRHAHRRGWLLLFESDGRPVAGALLERWLGDVRILAFGVDTSGRLPTGLLLEACYYHTIRFAVDSGFPRLSLGTVRPVLTHGVFRYKRKWGARLGRPSTWETFVLHCRNTEGVRAALTATPLVVDRGSAALAALTGTEGIAPAEMLSSVDTAGLGEIVLLLGDESPAERPRDPRLRTVPPGALWPAAPRSQHRGVGLET